MDFDGVVVHSHPVHKRAWQMVCARVGQPVTESSLEFITEGWKRQDILQHLFGTLTEAEMHEYGQLKDELVRAHLHLIQPVPGIPNLLADLSRRGLALAIASSGTRDRVNYLLEHLRIGHYFHSIITSDDVSRGKPAPDLFLTAAVRLGIPPGQLLAIEDAVCGIEAANAAGMVCIGVADTRKASRLSVAGARWVIQDFLGVTAADLIRLHASVTQRDVITRKVEVRCATYTKENNPHG